VETKHQKPLKSMICILSGFFISMKGRLFIPLRRDLYLDVQLNPHTVEILREKNISSLTMTPERLSFCYSQDTEVKPVNRVFGVDRNEKNTTFGDSQSVVQVNMKKVVKIKQTTREIVASFRRDDLRIRRQISRMYWKRANHRTDQMLHAVTNFMVAVASRDDATFALEDITDIRKLYRKGNGQGPNYRFRLNSWPQW
jgi:putative transposase